MTIRAFVFSSIFAMAATLMAATEPAAKPEPAPQYDKATEIDTMATVSESKEVTRDSPLIGTYLVVRSDSGGVTEVYLGPTEFVKSFEITFHKGDQLHLIGSKVKVGTANVVLARDVRRNETTLYLRDAKGAPYWPAPVTK